MAATYYSVKECDKIGGSANFIARWKSQNMVKEPIIECVMISARGQQGISIDKLANIAMQ